jgi:hypothetical protein
MYVSKYVSMQVCMYVRRYACMHVFIYVQVLVYMCVYIMHKGVRKCLNILFL